MVDEFKKINLTEDNNINNNEKNLEENGFKPLPESKKGSRKMKKIFLILGGLLGFVLLFYLIVGAVTFLLAQPMIARVQKLQCLGKETWVYVKGQDLPLADQKINEVQNELNGVKDSYKKIAYLKYIPLLSPYYKDGSRALDSAQAGVEAAIILLDAVTPYADVLGFKGQGSFVGGTAEDRIVKIVQTLDKVVPKLDEVVSKIEIIENNVNQINPNRYPKSIKGVAVRDQISKSKDTLAEVKTTLVETKPVIEVLPAILGYPDNKKYLVLFQNDGELRPTGGFITAFSVFDVESGKARSSRSDDIYSLDKKLGNRIKPPEILAEHLNVQAYHLRDMNFSPDFKVSMEEFLKYYEGLSGVDEVDGIITIDTTVLKSLIDVLGPVEVPGFGRFTNENDPRCNIPQVICALEYIVDEPIPEIVENRKSTILGPMMQEIMFKAYGSPKQQWPDLFGLLISSLKEKHMLMYFKESKIQTAAETFGAAGRVKDYAGDYLNVIDANLGGAKSNLYVTSQIEQTVEKVNGSLVKEVTITYLHPEPMDDCSLERAGGLCLSGVLQNYFRVYVPKGSELIEAMGSETEVEASEDLGKTVFAGFFKLRGDGGRAKIILRYRLPDGLESNGVLPILVQKQAGTKEIPLKTSSASDLQELKIKTDTELKLEL